MSSIYNCNIGSWHNSPFLVALDGFQSMHLIIVWKLVELLHPNASWKIYDCIQEDLCSWLTYANDNLDSEFVYKGPKIHYKFCNDYILVYFVLENNLKMHSERVANRFVMSNLATKSWERIQLLFDAIWWKFSIRRMLG